jgi:hypothetical protein
VTRAESIALAAVTALIAAIVFSYFIDLAGFGIAPIASAVVALGAACAVAALARPTCSSFGETGLFLATVIGTLTVLYKLSGPSLLPTGSGPDLTHHLLLVDYIERHRTLVHDPDAGRYLGEMVHYTPGFHLLAAIGGAIAGVNAFFAVLPVVVLSVSLKFGFFALTLLRLFRDLPGVLVASAAGTSLILALSPFTIQSFSHDSFLAQVVAELFAVVMWWALVAWDQGPSRWGMIVFGAAGTATFLTWPLWVGPLVVALILLLTARTDLPFAERCRLAIIGIAPMAVVGAVHVYGRTEGLGLVATSGAVTQPSVTVLGWWLPALALAGIVLALRHPASRPLLALAAGLLIQAAALWIVARRGGATTPYMAIKMMYLAAYPLAAAALLTVTRVVRTTGTLALPAITLVALSAVAASRQHVPSPVVSRDLWAVGSWARGNLPPACIDYLVGNEYTAYWLHLAVLGNPRADARSSDNDLYLTQPSMARWLFNDGGVPYAIAKPSILPAEIRERTRVLHQQGDAAVIARLGDLPPCR